MVAGHVTRLSHAQEGLWLLDRVTGGSPDYHVPVVVRLRGELDAGPLEAAVAALPARHEALRGSFPTGPDGRPRLQVAPELRLRLDRRDHSGDPEPERSAREAIAREILAPFDLAAGPLIRATLHRLGPADHVLVLCAHHAVLDDRSAELLAADLGLLHGAARSGGEPPPHRSTLTYAEVAERQRAWLAAGRGDEQVDHWRRRLAGAPPVLDLPADRPRPPVRSWAGSRVHLDMERDVAEALRELGRSHGTSLSTTLLAGWHALLARCTAGDVVVGIPVPGRPSGTEDVVGLFANMLPIRMDCSDDPTFAALLDRVRQAMRDALADQDVPFERLVEELAVARDPSAHPLFQVAFRFHEGADALPALEGLAAEPFPVERRTARFDLALALRETEAGLTGELEYATALLDAATVERMAGHLRTLLAAAAADPARRLSELPMRAPGEPDPAAIPPPPAVTAPAVHELVARHAGARPDAPAVRWRGGELTYGELLARAGRLAGRLRELGVGPDVVVAVCCRRSPATIVAMLAIQRAGGAHLLLDPDHPDGRLARVLDEVAGPALIVDVEAADRFAGRPETVVVLEPEGELVGPAPASVEPPPTDASALAYAVYTSGSTGVPKGVAVPHGALANVCAWYRRAFAASPGDIVAHVVGTSFDVAVLDVWGALTAAATLVLPPDEETRLDPRRLLAWVTAERATLAFLATPMAELALREPTPPDLCLRWMLVAGAKLRAAIPDGLTYRVADCYGPAECTVISTGGEVTAAAGGHIGRPVEGTAAVVATASRLPCPTGVPGELLLGGAGVARGYLRRPDLTAERFVPDPFGPPGSRAYRTGDRCRWRADGNLEFLGRIDNQVKVRGFRIELGEIEAVLARHPGVRQAVVTARQQRAGDLRLVAYAVPSGAAPATPAGLRDHLAAHLPDYMVPSAIVLLDALPTTASGKIDRQALPAPAAPAVEDSPRTPLEGRLAAVWAAVLGLNLVGTGEDFFAAGGHSLLLVELQRRLEDELGREIPLVDLFRHRSVSAFAAYLDRESAPEAAAPVRHGSLLCLRSPEHPTRMLFLPALGGRIEAYLGLAAATATDYGCWSAPVPGLRAGERMHDSMGSLAEHYVDLLRDLQPHGPYLLTGWSFGGALAYELALRLERLGETVGLLTVIDTDLPDPSLGGMLVGLDHAMARMAYDWDGGAMVTREELSGFTTEEQIVAYVARRLEAAGILYEHYGTADLDAVERAMRLEIVNFRAWTRYVPSGRYDGRLALLQTANASGEAPPEDLRVVRNGNPAVFRRAIQGTHQSILRAPQVERLAVALREALDWSRTTA